MFTKGGNKMRFTTSKAVLSFFDQFSTTTIDLTLTRMERALELLGNPQKRYRIIHVGGTNGKGSTTSFLRHILQENGYRVATFTSPHIEVFNERMQINGVMISDQQLLTMTNEVFEQLGEAVQTLGLTQFELMAIVMFYYFANEQPDWAIIEVGMGGRFDATNVVTPAVSIITNVSLDHQQFLGDSLAAITHEKAGIIKQGVPIVTTAKTDEVITILQNEARVLQAPLYQLGVDFFIDQVSITNVDNTFTYRFGLDYQEYSILLKGYHQVENASAALTALNILAEKGQLILENRRVIKALAQTTWIGRMEQILDRPIVYVDGAHNDAGIEQLCQTIQQYFSTQKCHIIFCAMVDKDVATMIPKLEAVSSSVTLTSFAFPRAAKAQALLQQSTKVTTQAEESFMKAFDCVCQKADRTDVIIVTGSLYFISYVRSQLKNKNRIDCNR